MGEIAGLLTALCWASSATIFTECGKRLGETNIVNRTRMLLALILLMVGNLVMNHQFFPLDAGWERWFWLGLSGIVGLTIGDGLMFQAYMLIGTRIAMLITAFSPVFSAIIAWVFLGETLGAATIVGILLAIAGVAIVVSEREGESSAPARPQKFPLGLLFSFVAVVAYAVGTVMSKVGLSGGFPTITGAAMRMLCALIVAWIPTIFRRDVKNTLKKIIRDRKTLLLIVAGSVVGPFLGIWMSYIAIQNTYVGVASTLISLAPIFLLPIAKWILKEKVSLRALAGTLVAIAGVAVIFLV